MDNEGFNRYIFGVYPGYADIPKAHVGEPRRIFLLSIGADICCGGFCGTERFDAKVAVNEQLRVAHRYYLPGFAFYFQMHCSRKILPEIVNSFFSVLGRK